MRKKNGYAMVLVLCVMALFTALCLILLLSTSLVLSAAQKQKKAEQCRILTVSLSHELQEELTSSDYYFESLAQEQQAEDESLWFYVKEQIGEGEWPAGKEGGQDNAYRHFQFEDLPEILGAGGSAEVVLSWKPDDSGEINGAVLTMEVTCTYAEQSCTVLSEYGLEISKISYVNDDATTSAYDRWQWSLNGRK